MSSKDQPQDGRGDQKQAEIGGTVSAEIPAEKKR